MIRFEHVTMQYASADQPALRDVNLEIGAGEFVLVTGRTGSGKSTLLRACNGLVPHFTGGTLTGRVLVDGIATSSCPPREVAHLVGMVGQDPLAGFVTDIVEEELAYGMEQLGLEPQVMRRRVEETLDLLGIVELRHRPLRTLSGGQQQRVAIGAALTMHPPVLVLDEPTSALDPTAAEDVLAILARLVHDLGTTVVLAEHRIERVIPFVDRMLHVTAEQTVLDGAPREVLEALPRVPPIVELGRFAGWQPLPLTVRDARVANRSVPLPVTSPPPAASRPQPDRSAAPCPLDAQTIVVRHGSVTAVRGIDLQLQRGIVTAIMGRNGAGKSSLLWALRDERSRAGGTVTTTGPIALVPQTASDLLVAGTVGRECRDADVRAKQPSGSCRALLDALAPEIDDETHPRDLSAGGQLALVLAMQLVAAPDVVLLDEPTRGLDYDAKSALAVIIRRLAKDGAAIAVATHDVEFVAAIADSVLVLADGRVLSAGPTVEVLAASPAFAPQVTKVLGAGWLTVDQVRDAITARA